MIGHFRITANLTENNAYDLQKKCVLNENFFPPLMSILCLKNVLETLFVFVLDSHVGSFVSSTLDTTFILFLSLTVLVPARFFTTLSPVWRKFLTTIGKCICVHSNCFSQTLISIFRCKKIHSILAYWAFHYELVANFDTPIEISNS